MGKSKKQNKEPTKLTVKQVENLYITGEWNKHQTRDYLTMILNITHRMAGVVMRKCEQEKGRKHTCCDALFYGPHKSYCSQFHQIGDYHGQSKAN